MIFVLSANYRNTAVEIREKMALSPQEMLSLQCRCREAGIPETVYLSTCNRCELYGNGDYEKALLLFSQEAGVDLSDLRGSVFVKRDEGAIRHLFRVASGMDSMAIGEDEILGQLRRAYVSAKEGGFTRYIFNTVFQAALEAAKRVKTQTLLSKSSVSIATLAAAQCHRFSGGKKKVLLIGASGDTGRKVMKNLLSYGDCEITATVRQSHSLPKEVRVVPFGDRYQYMSEAEIVVSATSSPHYTVTRALLEQNGIRSGPGLFIDLAMPRDIDECVLEIPGTRLLRIDDFERIAGENQRIRKDEIRTAENILLEEIDGLRKELAFHEFYPVFARMKEKMPKDMEQFIYRYRKAADADEFAAFLRVLSKVEMYS